MLTDKEMLEIAKKYLKKLEEEKAQELGQETLDPKYAINASPFLVEKKRRRVLHFGTHYDSEQQYEDYKNGNLQTALDSFWYPDEDRYSHK